MESLVAIVVVLLYQVWQISEFHDELPFFDNNFLATDANLIFLSKIDKD